MVKRNIRFFSCALIVVLCFTMISPSVFADMDSDRFGQWMGTALEACNIIGQSTLPVTAPIADFITDPFNITEGVYTAINYAFPRVNLETPSMTLESYLKRSSIQVRGDTITIDGIDYQDIWVTNDAAQAFRTNVLDLQTAFNIASNSNGNFVSGAGNIGGVPVFQTSSGLWSQFYTGVDSPFSFSGISVSPYLISGQYNNFTFSSVYSTVSSQVTSLASTYPVTYMRFGYSAQDGTFAYWIYNNNSGWSSRLSLKYVYSYEATPFDFQWVAQSIPAPQLSSDDGIHLLVPNNPDQFSDTEVQQNINNFNLTLRNNFDFDIPIDLSTDNNYTLFDSLFDIAFDLDINPSFGPYNVYPPSPTPTPSPTFEPVPWPTLEPTPEPTVTPTSAPTPEPSASPSPFPSPAPDVPMSEVTWGGFSEFADNLESSFFNAVVDAIATPFESLWHVIKNATGIWRYVVLWVGNISAPLNWSLSALGSAGSYFLSPFAAIAAAAVVIAVYRRIGK